ncbi:amidohydrolase family protein [Enterococcus faecium]|uniref:amidohydrolase family protein n=1 Tax=Enterococcus faecium TaxID=1352 RepID=UPI0003A8AFF4|nr:amidohydrolase family protein [Enterococcus faecium]
MYFEDEFRFCLEKFGVEHILWATDYPYIKNDNAKGYLSSLNLDPTDLEKIAHGNAEKFFNL